MSAMTELRGLLAVARHEFAVALLGTQSVVITALFLLVFGLGVESVAGSLYLDQFKSVERAFSFSHALGLWFVPAVGWLVGYNLLSDEREKGTIHFLATKPLSRASIVLGKAAGALGVIAVAEVVAALVAVVAALGIAGQTGDLGNVAAYLTSVWLICAVFCSLGLLCSSLVSRSKTALAVVFALYLVFGFFWAFLFPTGNPPVAERVLLHLLSPVTAWDAYANTLLLSSLSTWVDVVEEPTPYWATASYFLSVLLLWLVASLSAATLVFSRRDAA